MLEGGGMVVVVVVVVIVVPYMTREKSQLNLLISRRK
jgi:hypothetical protein